MVNQTDSDKRIRLISLGVGTLLVVLVIVSFVVSYNTAQAKLSEKAAAIADLQQQIANVEKASEATSADLENAEETIHSAKVVGEEVAGIQNDYTRLAQTDISNEAQQKMVYADMDALAERMDTYFGKDTDFRTVWYAGDTSVVENARWEFLSNYDFAGTTVPVIWRCSDSAGVVYAYVTAVYNAETNLFEQAVKSITSAGSAAYPKTGTETETDVDLSEYADSILSIMEGVDSGAAPKEYTEEELKEIEENNEARYQLQQQQGGIE